MKPFDLEAFKKGQKALTRDGRVATFVGVCEECYEDCQLIVSVDGTRLPISLQLNGTGGAAVVGDCDQYDLVSMVSRHKALIEAWQNGAKIEYSTLGSWCYCEYPSWDEEVNYRIKPEPVIHCLAYDAKRFDHESTTAVRARVVKKEVAQANGWKIIQEWEV